MRTQCSGFGALVAAVLLVEALRDVLAEVAAALIRRGDGRG